MAIKSLITLSLILLTIVSFTHCSDSKQSFFKCLGNTKLISNIEEDLFKLYNKEISLNSLLRNFNVWTATQELQKFKDCYLEDKSQNLQSETILTKLGDTILLATNCGKDVGPGLIILDKVISSIKNIKTEWKNLLMDGVVLAIVGNQSFNDCRSAWEEIKNIWSIGIEEERKFLN